MFHLNRILMKKIVLLISTILISISLNAQDNLHVSGEKVLNLGIGLGNALYSGTGYTSQMPPLSVSYEVGIADDFLDINTSSLSVGGYLGFATSKWEYAGWGYRYSNIIIGPRASLHYPLVDKLDTYAGLLLGYNIVSAKEIGDIDPMYNYDITSSGLIFNIYVGGRYYLSDNFAIMAELGYGIAYLNLGVALKL